MTERRAFDVAVIGAGVVGAAIARELSKYQLDVVLIEAGDDVGIGTSKANTAIWHTGFDAKPGSLEARLLRRGHDLLGQYAEEAGIPIQRTGALLVAWNSEQRGNLEGIDRNARANGYLRGRLIGTDELYRRERNLAPGATGALEIPDEGIVCPFTTPLAYATQALHNGVELLLESPVVGKVSDDEGGHVLSIAGGPDIQAAWAVNAAGLHSDEVDRLFGHDTFTIAPRRGELIVFDKLARPLVSHILLPVPTSKTKGMIVAPTVFGNVILGPTADDISDKTATESTAGGLAALLAQGRQLLPALLEEEVTAVYAGVRAASEHADYQIACYPTERYVCVGGIRSTGLSASMAIAEHVTQLLSEAGLELEPAATFEAVRMPNIGEMSIRPYEDAQAIRSAPDYGRMVCHCERVSLGEIRDACNATIPARTMEGLRRRTRAAMGRCQGFFCAARLTRILTQDIGRNAEDIIRVETR
ncbi:MAG: FAD-dependent oxidoreductase [Streptosporangiaceae bacterium]